MRLTLLALVAPAGGVINRELGKAFADASGLLSMLSPKSVQEDGQPSLARRTLWSEKRRQRENATRDGQKRPSRIIRIKEQLFFDPGCTE